MAVRRPVVERPDAAQHREAKEGRQEPGILERRGKIGGLEQAHIEGVETRFVVHRQRADESHHRTDEQVQGQFHGGVLARLDPAPNGDQQVHREDGDLVEEEQHEQVERGEDAEHARSQDEQEGKELARTVLNTGRGMLVVNAPRDADAREHDDARQQDERRADAVHAEDQVHAQRGQPGIFLDELVARHAVDQVLDVDPGRKDQGEGRRGQRQGARLVAAFRGHQQEQRRRNHGSKDNYTENWKIHNHLKLVR